MKIITVVLALMGMATSVYAGEVKGNPDRYFSIGLDLTGATLKEVPVQSYSSAGGQNLISTQNHPVADRFITADARVPVFSWLSANVHGGSWTQTTEVQSTSSGYTIGGGFRVYFTGE